MSAKMFVLAFIAIVATVFTFLARFFLLWLVNRSAIITKVSREGFRHFSSGILATLWFVNQEFTYFYII
eukprot:gene10007-11846_t